MEISHHTEDEFRAMIEEGMDQAIDHIAGRVEYARFRAALMRWLEEQDAEMERAAEAFAAEHPGETF